VHERRRDDETAHEELRPRGHGRRHRDAGRHGEARRGDREREDGERDLGRDARIITVFG